MMLSEIDPDLLTLLDEGELGNKLVSWAVDDIGLPVIRFIIDALETIKLSPARALLNIAMTQKWADCLYRDLLLSDLATGTLSPTSFGSACASSTNDRGICSPMPFTRKRARSVTSMRLSVTLQA